MPRKTSPPPARNRAPKAARAALSTSDSSTTATITDPALILADSVSMLEIGEDDDGGGGGDIPDDPGLPTMSITTPVAGATVSGAEPGVPFQVAGTFGPSAYSPTVSVTVDGIAYPATVNRPAGTWAATARAYRPGSSRVTVTVTATYGGEVRQASKSTTVTVSLTSQAPVLTVTAPAPNATVEIRDGGGTVPVNVTTSDQFGPRTVTVTCEGRTTTLNPSSTGYAGDVVVDPRALGPCRLVVACVDAANLTGTRVVWVNKVDKAPPTLTISFPEPGDEFTTSMTPTATGTLLDGQSGVIGGLAKVVWSFSATDGPTARRQAEAGGRWDGADNWATWSASIALPDIGSHNLYFWATDASGNTTPSPVVVPITVISTYTPSTWEKRLDDRQYLAALIRHAQDRVKVSDAGGGPTSAQLAAVLRQPLDLISRPLSAEAEAGRREVNQLRVPVEILRAHIMATGGPTAPGAAGEAAYRTAAYGALLAAVGTSYAELRLARGAGTADRQALADRLGLPLASELDTLLLDGPALTETALEDIFGLPATVPPPSVVPPILDVLRPPSTSWLLQKRQTAQAAEWVTQDRSTAPRTFDVLVDPDVVTAADVAPGPGGDPVRALLSARTTELANRAQALATARGSGGFAAMVALGLPGVDLAALAQLEVAGVDLSGKLAAAGLTWAGFRCLRQIAALEPGGTLTEAEWADAVAILVGAFKRSRYQTWRAQEGAVVLASVQFVPGGPAPQSNHYRVDPRARADWQALLTTRAAQRQALDDAMAAAVASAERAALPILRDALLADVAATLPTGADAGERLTALFQVDMKAAGILRTTRLAQATESLKSLLFAVRSGALPDGHPAKAWTPTGGREAFDAAWRWLGEHPTWRTAVQAFLVPERHLDPTLLLPNAASPTPYDALWTRIRGSRSFRATDANAAAAAYVAARREAPGSFPNLTYLDPQRSTEHQNALADLSAGTTVGDLAAAREAFWAVPMLIAQRLQAAGEFLAALDWYWLLYPYDTTGTRSIYEVINSEIRDTPASPDLTFPPGWTGNLRPFDLVTVTNPAKRRPAPYTRYTLLSLARCLVEYADVEFTRETNESVARARTLYLAARTVLGHPRLEPVTPSTVGEPALPIPELVELRAKVEVQLNKLRQGRNIAGLARTPNVTIGQPTPYRFKVLLERTRQLVAQAEQIQAGYLAALEKYDAKTLQLHDADNAFAMAGAQVRLQVERSTEATHATAAARAQSDKAVATAAMYAGHIAAPANQYEEALLRSYGEMRAAKNLIAGADMAVGIAQVTASAASVTNLNPVALGASIAQGAAIGVRGGATMWLNNLESQMQATQLNLGIEQRRVEWRMAQASAQQDELVADAQVTVAGDHEKIVKAEHDIASQQEDQARASLDLLRNQFTNADLYQWMSRTLGGVYRFFLHQATATARLAQAQLAFERAEPERSVIQADYWLTLGDGQSDRAGLTGAERLAADVARLDDYAFSTDRRRLNLSQTFSLSQLMPMEFLDFQRTGTLSFATPMSLFDGDFPGQYLRLIRQVRTSVVALIPPGRGIRATLSTNGISRVTTPQRDGFADMVVRHDPAMVALTSPANASGVFDLDTQTDMLGPFEGSGVATTWELSLPKAANPFDFTGISDVMITIDYTALYDPRYRVEVVNRLNANRACGSDRVFSLARDFPDQWYALNNPDPAVGRSVTFTVREVDLPPNIESIKVAEVALHLSTTDDPSDTDVTLTKGGCGGTAKAKGGIASTRRSDADAWNTLRGEPAEGEWRLSFPPSADPRFATGHLDDVLLVINWTGQSPAWP